MMRDRRESFIRPSCVLLERRDECQGELVQAGLTLAYTTNAIRESLWVSRSDINCHSRQFAGEKSDRRCTVPIDLTACVGPASDQLDFAGGQVVNASNYLQLEAPHPGRENWVQPFQPFNASGDIRSDRIVEWIAGQSLAL